MIATVDWDALFTVIWSSVVAGVGVTVAYGLAILGATRAVQLSRHGRPAEALVYGIVGLAGIATILAAIVFGILVLTDK